MTSLVAASILFLSATAAPAQPGSVTGTLHERALMKTIQVIYVEKVDGDTATAPTEGATMNQKGNTYIPHVLPVVAGTKVAFQTMDPELHNIYAKTGDEVLFNTALPSGAPVWNRTLKNPGVVALTCNIHSEMSAFIVVLQNRFFTLPDAKTGEWKIDGIPAGNYVVRVWGEKLGEDLLKKSFPVTVAPGASTTLEIAKPPAI